MQVRSEQVPSTIITYLMLFLLDIPIELCSGYLPQNYIHNVGLSFRGLTEHLTLITQMCNVAVTPILILKETIPLCLLFNKTYLIILTQHTFI